MCGACDCVFLQKCSLIFISFILFQHYPVRSGKTQLANSDLFFRRSYLDLSSVRSKNTISESIFGVGGAAGAGNLFVRAFVCPSAADVTLFPGLFSKKTTRPSGSAFWISTKTGGTRLCKKIKIKRPFFFKDKLVGLNRDFGSVSPPLWWPKMWEGAEKRPSLGGKARFFFGFL